MDEFMEAVETEGTTPTPTAESAAETDVQDETAVDTQPMQQSDAEDADTTPPSADDDAAAQPTEEPATAPITIPVRFNHEERELTVEEATAFAQKGMAYDRITPTLDKIRRLAAGCGKSMDEMVDALVEASDNNLRQQLLMEAGGNQSVADRLYELEKSKRENAYTTRQQAEAQAELDARNSMDERLAAEFLELQAEFPELSDFKAVPREVVSEAIKKNISLYDSYLRYERKNTKNAAQNARQQTETAAVTMGSRADRAPAVAEDPLIAAMMEGVRAAL